MQAMAEDVHPARMRDVAPAMLTSEKIEKLFSGAYYRACVDGVWEDKPAPAPKVTRRFTTVLELSEPKTESDFYERLEALENETQDMKARLRAFKSQQKMYRLMAANEAGKMIEAGREDEANEDAKERYLKRKADDEQVDALKAEVDELEAQRMARTQGVDLEAFYATIPEDNEVRRLKKEIAAIPQDSEENAETIARLKEELESHEKEYRRLYKIAEEENAKTDIIRKQLRAKEKELKELCDQYYKRWSINYTNRDGGSE